MPTEHRQHINEARGARRTAALAGSLILGLGFLLTVLYLPRIAIATGPNNPSTQQRGQAIGVASSALECLATGSRVSVRSSGIVRLTWRGRIEKARLVMRVAGSEAAHSIKVNEQPVALAPIHPQGRSCGDGEYFYLAIPARVLMQGDNLIEITNDAIVDDRWTASDVRLEVFGDVAPAVPVTSGQLAATSTTSVTQVITFANSYDESSQPAMIQTPDGYTGDVPTPLFIFVHGRYSVMEEGIDTFGSATNIKGWLLASPQLHGSWKPDPSCYSPSVNCDSDDEVLTEQGKPGAFHYASLESQYDLIGTLGYMVGHYNVKLDQVYLMGDSMGGQLAVVAAAKYPHVFAAIFDNKGPTDMAQWYNESSSSTSRRTMRKECHIAGVPQYPDENPFCYQRRSGVHFASNYLHTPISISHSVSDTLVPIHHSRDLRDAINSYGPDRLASVYEDTVIGPACDDGGDYHCYSPDPMTVLNYLGPFTLNNNPTSANISADESQSYYWLNLSQTGGAHWSQVRVAYYPISVTVMAAISDSYPLTVGLNLSSTPITSTAGTSQPGMGLPATTYLIRGGGLYSLTDYVSGYLTASLANTGQYTLTISAITASLSASPTIVPGWQPATSTIRAVVVDHLNDPVPDSTVVQLFTTQGLFPNDNTYYTATATGGLISTTLTLSPEVHLAEVIARVGSVTNTVSVNVIYPAIGIRVRPDPAVIFGWQPVTYTYQITNTGDSTLTAVTLVDNNGTPGNGSDDLTVCAGIVLSPGAATNCTRSVTVTQTITIAAIVTGTPPVGPVVTNTDSAVVRVFRSIYLPVVVRGG